MTAEERADAYWSKNTPPGGPCEWSPDYCGMVDMVAAAMVAATLAERSRIVGLLRAEAERLDRQTGLVWDGEAVRRVADQLSAGTTGEER